MVRPPFVQNSVKRGLVVEIAIAAVDRQDRRRDRHNDGTRTPLDQLMPLARRYDDQLVTVARRCPQLGVHVSANAAALGRVEGANIDDPHGSRKRSGAVNYK